MSDASDMGWGLVVTQVCQWKPEVPIHQQTHELLICMGGFKLYCDHRNIVYLFAPGKELKKHVRGKLLRWSTKLLEYRYSIEHIEGIHNLWTDLISRWGSKPLPTARIHSAKRFTRAKRKRNHSVTKCTSPLPLRPLDQDGFTWPTIDEIRNEQSRHDAPRDAILGNDKLWWVKNMIWIPSEAHDLTQRLLIVAHCGRNGHRGVHVMENHIRRSFHIPGLTRIARDVCLKCLLCLHVKGGVVIPRPFSETHYTFEPNDTLHWDFFSVGDSFGASRYVLVLKDEATHFAELVACDSPTSAVAASTILDCAKSTSTRVQSPLARLALSITISTVEHKSFARTIVGQPCSDTLDTIILPGGKGRVDTLTQLQPRTIERLNKLQKTLQQRPSLLKTSVNVKQNATGHAHTTNRHTMDVHPSRLKFYADDSLNVTEELRDHIASQGTLLAVEAIVVHKLNSDMEAYEVKVKWLGLETIEDSWEPLKTMCEDVPQLLLQYANYVNDVIFTHRYLDYQSQVTQCLYDHCG
ncbi:unnamed protein product [Phytophthora fragariaefolia]|uniref:Unnamed protein product n=1 Tax=Phytophthora fragariaefolia TaxID=1490495 RepID=A0A9W7CHU8_9STRA|nr:unnamed protein product [Phytophthora fragariaefolia]